MEDTTRMKSKLSQQGEQLDMKDQDLESHERELQDLSRQLKDARARGETYCSYSH